MSYSYDVVLAMLKDGKEPSDWPIFNTNMRDLMSRIGDHAELRSYFDTYLDPVWGTPAFNEFVVPVFDLDLIAEFISKASAEDLNVNWDIFKALVARQDPVEDVKKKVLHASGVVDNPNRSLVKDKGLYNCGVDYYALSYADSLADQALAATLRSPEFTARFASVSFKDLLESLKRFANCMSGGLSGKVCDYVPTGATLDALGEAIQLVKPKTDVHILSTASMEFLSQYSFYCVSSIDEHGNVCIEYHWGSHIAKFVNGQPVDHEAVRAMLLDIGAQIGVRFNYIVVSDDATMLANYIVCSRNFKITDKARSVEITAPPSTYEFKGPKFVDAREEQVFARVKDTVRYKMSELAQTGARSDGVRQQYLLVLHAAVHAVADPKCKEGVDLLRSKMRLKKPVAEAALVRIETEPFPKDVKGTLTQLLDVRAKGQALRNHQPREEVTKNSGTFSTLHSLPNHYEVGYKFKHLFEKLTVAERKQPVDFYGTASHGWLEQVCAAFGPLEAGTHAFYDTVIDKDVQRVGPTGLQVQKADVLQMQTDVGRGKGLVSDAASSDNMSFKGLKDVCDSVLRANYDWVVLKLFFCAGMQEGDYDWITKLEKLYPSFQFAKPGKLQSAEFFVVLSKTQKPNPLPTRARFNGLVAKAYEVMRRMSEYMDLCTLYAVYRPCKAVDVWYDYIKVSKPEWVADPNSHRPLAQGYRDIQKLARGASRLESEQVGPVIVDF